MKASKVLNRDLCFDHKVNKITINSKLVEKDDVFIAIKGKKVDGNNYIEEAIKKGAKTIVSENSDLCLNYNEINIVIVKDLSKYLGEICKRFYGDLSNKVKLIGITGTNGKTTTATLVYKYYRFLNRNIALISTNGNYINDEYYETTNTTPNIIEIYEVLRKAIREKCEVVVMEVSSHSIYMNRIFGLTFEIGALTNLTHDHLDYHKTMYDYHYTKIMFLSKCRSVILNTEYLKYVPFMSENILLYGDKEADFQILNIKENLNNTLFEVQFGKEYFFKLSLLAEYNVYNAVLFMAIISLLDEFDYELIFSFLESEISIPGRMEIVNQKPMIIVDFAHTPDAIERILLFLNKYKKEEGKIITVVGMGGARDKKKRKSVGLITTKLADVSIYTSDNSRNEKTIDIIHDIVSGAFDDSYIIEEDRFKAIEKAISMATESDIIAILGRGVEKELEFDSGNIPFVDKEVVLKLLYKE